MEDEECIEISQKMLESKSCAVNVETSTKNRKARGSWTGKLDFILTCIGFAVGLGNIWRFPYLCYKSGGGAFFIPYFIFLILCGIPLFFLEVSFAQFGSLSPIAIWRISPLFKGIGVGMVIVSGIVCVYYNVIIAWTLYYLFMSFRSTLPWSTCGNSWNTKYCVEDDHNNASALNGTSNENGTYSIFQNVSVAQVFNHSMRVSASEEYWENQVLKITSGIEIPGVIRWELLLFLIFAWLIVFLCLFKGIEVLGKLMHFAAPFPYFVLFILLIRGVTLPGSLEGIKFYIIPRFEELKKFQVWGDAALQIFYSIGMAWGGIITMASYNEFNHDVYKDALIVPMINCATSIFAGFVIFSVLGFMAFETGVSVDNVVRQGPGLTFVAYPEALSRLPISSLWAVLFFLMLFIIGLDSQFGMFETMLSAFMDEYPEYLRGKKTLICAVACFVELLLGLPCITQGGIYVLQIMDWYCASFSLMLISLAECVVIAWIYGVDRFYKDIELMIGYQPCRWWKISWCFITPAVILFIWLFSVSTLGPVTYGDIQYPPWAIRFGWILGLVSLVPIPLVMIYSIYRAEGTFMERVKSLIKPAPNWGPVLPENRKLYLASL
ncbi:sodium- and chloride-dependent glycine transporter 1-like [Octopus vulgaris]|uniref:Transporter n=2 Tax=Octopus TaxID=6643 RepID=A0AA36BI84_OCTVU|nr:sodium- and chloride-dependent glycine transporter 1-like [Octopus vulgaris]